MKHLRGHILLLALLFGGITNSWANDDKCEVKGRILDNQEAAIPYASIAFLQPQDSSIVAGTVSDDQGNFSLKLKQGDYLVRVSFLSYKDYFVSVSLKEKTYDFGKIILQQTSSALEEVNVVTERSEMSLQLDKRVFTVGQDLANSGQNASEILDNIPSVAVDVDGNVSLRGSQGVRILIDGKPSGLIGSDPANALKMFQGNMIDRIEVITNPSARYDAQGEVGIINIILKKENREGINGVFSGGVGWPHNHNFSAGLNYRRDKINLFTNYGLNYRERPGGGFTEQSFENTDTSYYFERLREHVRGGISHNLQLGLDYYASPKDVITVSGLYKYSDGNNRSNLQYDDFDENRTRSNSVFRNEVETELQTNYEATVDYKKTFDSDKHKLDATVKWIKSDDLEVSDFTEESSQTDYFKAQHSESTENEERFLAKVDYVKPIGKEGQFETGMQTNLRTIENAFLVEEQNSEGNFEPLPGFDNIMVYTENIHAAYVMYGNKYKSFGYQAGLRSEYSDIKTELLKTGDVNPRDYLNFFPSVHLSKEFKEDNSVQLSYSRRLSRPRFWYLLPFFNYSDPRSFFSGNPDLDPEYTNSYELSHLKYWDKASLMSSVYYRKRTGVIERITVVDSEGFTRIFPINMATQDDFGLEFNVSKDMFDWWKMNANANFYRAITRGEYEGLELFSDTYTWTGRLSSTFTLFKKIDLQTTFDYRAPRITTQGRQLAIYFLNLGASMDVLKKNGTITLSGRDLFNTRKRRFYTETNGLVSEGYFQWRARQITLTFSYRLNQKKERKPEGGFGGEEGGDF